MLTVALLLGIFVYGLFRKTDLYTCFTEGAKTGLQTTVKTLPYIAAALLMIGLIRSSGLLTGLQSLIGSALTFMGVPPELLPLILLKPISGSASIAQIDQLIREFGANSRIVTLACVILGAGETLLYITALYLGSQKLKGSRYILPVGLGAYVVCVLTACAVCGWLGV